MEQKVHYLNCQITYFQSRGFIKCWTTRKLTGYENDLAQLVQIKIVTSSSQKEIFQGWPVFQHSYFILFICIILETIHTLLLWVFCSLGKEWICFWTIWIIYNINIFLQMKWKSSSVMTRPGWWTRNMEPSHLWLMVMGLARYNDNNSKSYTVVTYFLGRLHYNIGDNSLHVFRRVDGSKIV